MLDIRPQRILIDPTIQQQRSSYEHGIRYGIRREGAVLCFVLGAGFIVRFLVRLAYGEEYFWKNSYSLFYDLAQSIAAGRGLSCYFIGVKYAHRPPVYPLFLVLTMVGGKNYVVIVLLQSIIGAGTALCAFLIGRELFDQRIGLLAAAGVAFYPYFVMHDTALQETGMFTFLTALAVLLLLKSRTSISKVVWFAAGLFLGLAVLTRVTLALFVPFAVLWIPLFTGGTRRKRLGKTAIVAAAFTLVVMPWLVRNYFVLGNPTLSTLTGLNLWAGNNEYTFARYPNQSIDRSTDEAMDHLEPQERERIQQLASDEIAQNSWFINKAWEYIENHRAETLRRSVEKIAAAFSWKQNPARETLVQTAYFLSYFPALILGVSGAVMARQKWKEHGLIYMLFFSFIVVTAIFFGHTSHRSYVDVYLIVFSAYAIATLYRLITAKANL